MKEGAHEGKSGPGPPKLGCGHEPRGYCWQEMHIKNHCSQLTHLFGFVSVPSFYSSLFWLCVVFTQKKKTQLLGTLYCRKDVNWNLNSLGDVGHQTWSEMLHLMGLSYSLLSGKLCLIQPLKNSDEKTMPNQRGAFVKYWTVWEGLSHLGSICLSGPPVQEVLQYCYI